MARVKICGLSEPETLRAAVRAGADWVGFVFVEGSPRAVTLKCAAGLLAQTGTARTVALLSDAGDAAVERAATLGVDVLQLHGAETPDRVAQIKARTGLEVWKALGVGEARDLERAAGFEAADALLIDARPPEGAGRAGGHGRAFDWTLLEGWAPEKPWLLAGGLHAGNVAEAITATGADAVDVSTGVERARGVKDAALIEAFIIAAKAA